MQDSVTSQALPQGGSADFSKFTSSFKLFDLEPDLDASNPKEDELSSAFNRLQKLFEGKSTLKISAEIQEKVHTMYEDINCGLLYGILTDPTSATKYLNFLRIAVKDHFVLISEKLLGLASSYSFRKFGSIPRKQLIWLLEALCDNSILPFQKTFMFLIRQVKACDLSSNTLSIAAGVVRIINKHREKLSIQSIELFQISVYSFLRMIPEHIIIPQLCRTEMEFVLYALYKKFSDCIPIGRDLLRALQDVSAIPEFSTFWKRLLNEPQSLCKKFNGIYDLTTSPTPKWIICSRLTPQMETRLAWILLSVAKPLDSSFLSRYISKFLKASSYEFLYVDLIRFICAGIHPTNEIIKSNVVQRWDAILYILKSIKSQKVAQQAKLALFYDFIFWNSNVDNIMNIEPSILLIEKSIKFPNDANMHISTSLIEFLYLIVEHYSQDLSTSINININLAVRELISKGVLRSIKQIYSSKLNMKSRSHLEALFPQFIQNEDSLPSVTAIIDNFNHFQAHNRSTGSASIEHPQTELQLPESNPQSTTLSDTIDTAFLRKTAQITLNECASEEFDASRAELIKTIDSIRSLTNNPIALIRAITLVYSIFSFLNESSTFNLDKEFNKEVSLFEISLPNIDEMLDERSWWALSPILCFLEASNERYLSLSSPDKFPWNLYTNVLLMPEKKLLSVTLYLWVIRYCLSCSSPELPKIFLQSLDKVGTKFGAFLYSCLETIQREDIDFFFAILDISYSLFPQETTGNMDLVTLMLQVMDPKNLLTITKKLETDTWRVFGSSNTSAVIRYIYKTSTELSEPELTFLWRIFLSEFSEKTEEASDLAVRMLETGSVLSKSAEATYAFQKFLTNITPDEQNVRLLLMSKHVDAAFILQKWLKKVNLSECIIPLVCNAAKDLEGDASKDIIDPRLIPHIKYIVRQLQKIS